MGLTKYTGTGRAKCKECDRVIKKGEKGLESWGYRMSQKFCNDCIKRMLK